MISGREFHQFLSYSDPVNAGLSSILNVYLIYLIMTKSPKEFGSYRYLLIFSSVFEMAYAILEAYLIPIHYSAGTSDIVLISVSDKTISRYTIRVLNSAYWGGFGATQAIYAVHFIYRYFSVSRNTLLESFNSWKIIFWLLFPILMGLIWALIGLSLCSPDSVLTELVRESILSSFGEPIDSFDYLGGTMYDIEKDGSIIFHFNFMAAVTIMSLLVSVCFAIIIYCAVMCYSFIQKMMASSSTVSPKARSIQSQLFYALIIQIAIPTVLLDGPLTLFLTFNITNSGIKGYSGYFDFAISLFPVIDPLPNFFIIRPYRKAVLGCLRKHKIGVSGSTYIQSSSNIEMRSHVVQ